MHRDPAKNVLRPGLCVLHLDVEVAVLVEDARIDELVLQLLPRPGPVHRRQVAIRELALWVLVQPPLIAVRREVVDVEVVLLHVLAVVALGCSSGRTDAPSGSGPARSIARARGTIAAGRR